MYDLSEMMIFLEPSTAHFRSSNGPVVFELIFCFIFQQIWNCFVPWWSYLMANKNEMRIKFQWLSIDNSCKESAQTAPWRPRRRLWKVYGQTPSDGNRSHGQTNIKKSVDRIKTLMRLSLAYKQCGITICNLVNCHWNTSWNYNKLQHLYYDIHCTL